MLMQSMMKSEGLFVSELQPVIIVISSFSIERLKSVVMSQHVLMESVGKS